MPSPWFGEFMGTLMLILLGDGLVAGVLLKKSKAEGSGWIVITAGWALAVMCGVFTAIACGSPGAHLNPAVTLGVALQSGDFNHFLPFVSAQLLGAFIGASLVYLHYLPHWEETLTLGPSLAFNRPGDPQSADEFCFEDCPFVPPCSWWCNLFSSFGRTMTGLAPTWWLPRLGYWPLAWGNHRLCHQSRAGSGPKNCPLCCL